VNKFIPYIILLIVATGCGNSEVNEKRSAYFHGSRGFGGSGIMLYDDGTYWYSFGDCTYSGRDSGSFLINESSIILHSVLESEKTKEGLFDHEMIVPLTGEVLKLKDSTITHGNLKKTSSSSTVWKLDYYFSKLK